MGIYIDMEMPEDGLKNIMILADGRVFQFSGYGNPKLLGTAVSVPPHGRLGDLDELYASLKKWLMQNGHSMTEATRVWIHGVLEGIAATPTVIPTSEEIN